MAEKLGIIPAAGRATRWGGIYKELLPVKNGTCLLDHTLNAFRMADADACLLVTSKDKLLAHAGHLSNWLVYYTIQTGEQDAWSAIAESLPLRARWNMYAMPDTYYPADIFTKMPMVDFCIGYFETDIPDRFGILTECGIVDKMTIHDTQKAWGVLGWSSAVVDLWMRNINAIRTHTQAFNMAIDEFGYELVKMDYYHDMASFADYEGFIRGTL